MLSKTPRFRPAASTRDRGAHAGFAHQRRYRKSVAQRHAGRPRRASAAVPDIRTSVRTPAGLDARHTLNRSSDRTSTRRRAPSRRQRRDG